MMMKKSAVLFILLAFIVCVTLAGCAEEKTNASSFSGTSSASAVSNESTDPGTSEESAGTESGESSIETQSAASAVSGSSSKQESSAAARVSSQTVTSVKPSTSSTAPAVQDVNLLNGLLQGVNTKDKWKMYDWDLANKYITCSKSLECAWGNGYGKSYLLDGVKSSKELLFDEGAWVSCTVKPGWGENSGEIDTSTVSFKKALNEWLIFDLQKNCSINKVNFSTLYKTSSHGMPADFKIEVSSDKSSWTTVVDEKGYEQDISNVDQSFKFTAKTARYVRLSFTKASTSIDKNLVYCIALSEVEIWGHAV